MSKSIKPDKLGVAIGQELELYAKDVTDRVNAAGEKAAKKLLKRTKATAPEGKRHGKYKKALNVKAFPDPVKGARYVWNAGSEYRLTHLLVKGHATKDGDRTAANPFLQNALAEVLPEYEHAVEEAVKG